MNDINQNQSGDWSWSVRALLVPEAPSAGDLRDSMPTFGGVLFVLGS